MKHWEAAGKNDATYEKDVLAPMSVSCCDFPDPRFWLATTTSPVNQLSGVAFKIPGRQKKRQCGIVPVRYLSDFLHIGVMIKVSLLPRGGLRVVGRIKSVGNK